MSLLQRLNEKNALMAENSDVKTASDINKIPDASLKTKLHKYLVEELKAFTYETDNQLKQRIPELVELFFQQETDVSRLTFEQKNMLMETIANEVTGYGPITPFLSDKTITEIMVNGPYQIYVEKKGKKIKTDSYFRDDEHVMQIIEKIVAPLGRRIDESSPMVDARLPDGSRVNAIIPPLSLKGPSITIRKFPESRLQISDLIGFGTLSENMAAFLDACVKARLNIFISGGTGSGKTTLLNVLSNFIPHDERIITIEDAAELQLGQEHVLSLETRPANVEGRGAVTIRDLVKNSLRMTPDRVVIGEVRSGEALDMLQAMNTGHDGSLATGHSNSPRDMLSRLETMVLMAGMEFPVKAIREQIASAVDLIVQQSKLKDGSRKITHISEVLGMEGETIVLQDIFVFKQTGISLEGKIEGAFVPTGIRPYSIEKMEHYGIDVLPQWFQGVM